MKSAEMASGLVHVLYRGAHVWFPVLHHKLEGAQKMKKDKKYRKQDSCFC